MSGRATSGRSIALLLLLLPLVARLPPLLLGGEVLRAEAEDDEDEPGPKAVDVADGPATLRAE